MKQFDPELVRKKVSELPGLDDVDDTRPDTINDRVEEAFNDAYRWIGCAREERGTPDEIVPELLTIFGNDIEGLKVLDLGCGAPAQQHYFGVFPPTIAEALHALGAEVTGVDFRTNDCARYNHVVMDFFDIVDGRPVQELEEQFEVVFMAGCSAGGIERESEFPYKCKNFGFEEYITVMNHFLEYARPGALIGLDASFVVGTEGWQRIKEQEKKWKQEGVAFEESERRGWMEKAKLAKELFEAHIPIEIMPGAFPRIYEWALKK